MQPTSITTAMQRTSITTTAMQPISITTAMQRTSITTATATTSSDNFAAATWNAATVQQQQQQQQHHHHVLVPHFATEDTKKCWKSKKRKEKLKNFVRQWLALFCEAVDVVSVTRFSDSMHFAKNKKKLKIKRETFYRFLNSSIFGGGEARLLIQQSEFESRRSLQFILCKIVWKESKQTKERPRAVLVV